MSNPDFLEKCVVFLSNNLGIDCEVDNIKLDRTGPQSGLTNAIYKLWEYTIMCVPGHENLVFIWSPTAYFLGNLDTQLVFMRLGSGEILKKAGINSQGTELSLVFAGIPAKKLSAGNIYGMPYFTKIVYGINHDPLELVYKSNDITSYTQGATPAV